MAFFGHYLVHARRLCCALLLTGILPSALAAPGWVAQSNREAQPVLALLARYAPEEAARLGVEGYDEAIFDSAPRLYERMQADRSRVIEQLQVRLEQVSHPKVRQDLQILIQSQRDAQTSAHLHHDMLLPYVNLPEVIFYGFHGLLDARVDASRYPAALVRLKRYTGAERGYTPSVKQVMAHTEARFKAKGLLGPYRGEIEQDLENYERYIQGIKDLFEKSGLEGWSGDYEVLAGQLREYGDWVRTEILPRARDRHLLPEAVYADALRNYGVRMEPRELIERASFGFMAIRNEMQALARRIAKARGLKSADYRDVIRALKRETLDDADIVAFYRRRLDELEAIIRREDIVSLPRRDARIRLASEAEAAGVPAPHVSIPRLIGNTGEYAEFVIPLGNPNVDPGERMDDFSFDAVAWTLTAHEARPGHEMQFAAMLENGVSTARAVFALNSANVEGWALYAEALMYEYQPLEGQLLSLQWRLIRAARAFLDPMLNLGMMEPQAARDFLIKEVVLSPAMAAQEIDRYTFKAPGQATSYYYGLMKLESMRTRVELRMRERFQPKAYHDFILAQGLLPLDLLEASVMEEFVPASKSLAAGPGVASHSP